MKTVKQLREELKQALAFCSHDNDNTLAAHVNENINWAWNNWEEQDLKDFYEGDKPDTYTDEFRDHWIDCEDFDTELEFINNPAN